MLLKKAMEDIMESTIKQIQTQLNELETIISTHNQQMFNFRNEIRNYKELDEYKEMQKLQSKNAKKRNELEKELRTLEKEYAIATLEDKYKKKFDEVLLIKKGKYAGQIHTLCAFGRIYRQSGSGRWRHIEKNNETQKMLTLLEALKVNVKFDNDAPRGGKLGEFYQINENTKFWKQYKKYELANSKY